jgi:dUTP pyrophosphatase
MMAIRFKRMLDDAILPFRADPGSAGYDLSSPVDAIVQPHSMEFIKSGWAVEIPKGFFGAIYARSGLATHHHVRLANDGFTPTRVGKMRSIVHPDGTS